MLTSRDLICTFSLMDSFNVDSTYTRYDSRSKSILDFVFISRDLSNCVTKVSIGDFHDNHSDHLPVEVELSLRTPIVHERSSHLSNVINIMWSKLSPSNLSHYSSTMETALDFLDIPPSILHGQNLCSDDSHKCDLEVYFSQIIDCITLADSVLKRSCFRALKPYWSPELSFLKHQSCIHHKAWLDNGKPTTGYIYNNYLVSRSDYRRKLRQEKRSKLQSADEKMYEILLTRILQVFGEHGNPYHSPKNHYLRKLILSQAINVLPTVFPMSSLTYTKIMMHLLTTLLDANLNDYFLSTMLPIYMKIFLIFFFHGRI